MAHRDDVVGAQNQNGSIDLNLRDMEPVLGLVAAVSSFCALLTPDQYKVFSPEQTEALGTAQALLWRLEHSRPEVT
jgi:hypothetical protein